MTKPFEAVRIGPASGPLCGTDRATPDGLRGEAIPTGARIVALVDSFDAMTHDRPYRAGRPVEDALAELRRGAGRPFDPEFAALFLDRHARPAEPAATLAAAAYTRGLLAVG